MSDYIEDLAKKEKIIIDLLHEKQKKKEDVYLTQFVKDVKEKNPHEKESVIRDAIIYLTTKRTIDIDKGPHILKILLR